MEAIEFIYKEIPHTRGSVDKCINITPNEMSTMMDKYAILKVEEKDKELREFKSWCDLFYPDLYSQFNGEIKH
jgi:hypothetical protein